MDKDVVFGLIVHKLDLHEISDFLLPESLDTLREKVYHRLRPQILG
jgi:hypothetical protein